MFGRLRGREGFRQKASLGILWTYSFAKKRKVYGLHIVALLWCTSDGRWRIPVAFRLWRPKRSCAPHAYRTKLELAQAMLKEVLGSGLRPKYIVFDTHYTAGWFTKLVGRLGLSSGWGRSTLGRSYSGALRGKVLPSWPRRECL